jgi:hypothetical protein
LTGTVYGQYVCSNPVKVVYSILPEAIYRQTYSKYCPVSQSASQPVSQSASQPVSQSASKKYILSIFALKTCLLVRSFYAQQIISAPMVAILTTVTIIEKIINIVIVIAAAAAAIIITIIFMIINDKNKNNNSNNNNLDNE